MKILFIIPNLNYGGAERVMCHISNFLSRNNNVTVLTFNNKQARFDLLMNHICIDSNCGKNVFLKLNNLIKRIFIIRQKLKEINPDLVISFMESANIPSIISNSLLKRKHKLFLSVRNNPDMFPWFYKVSIFILYRFAEKVVVPSQGVKVCLEKYGIKNERIKFIPNPIDIDLIKNLLKDKNDLNLNLPKKYILSIGRLVEQKDFDRLLKIFSKLEKIDLNLVIVGRGPLKEKLNSMIRDLKLKDKVFFIDHTSNPFLLYKNALCYVSTSRYEGWPNVLNEAIASGCPVLSYDCKFGPREIINQDNGILIKDDDDKSMLEAIKKVYDDETLRLNLIKNGRKGLHRFSLERISKKWIEI